MKHREFTYRGTEFIDKKAYQAALELIGRLEKDFEAMSKLWIDKAMEIRKIALNEAAMTSVPVADVEILLKALKNSACTYNTLSLNGEIKDKIHHPHCPTCAAIKAYQALRGTKGEL